MIAVSIAQASDGNIHRAIFREMVWRAAHSGDGVEPDRDGRGILRRRFAGTKCASCAIPSQGHLSVIRRPPPFPSYHATSAQLPGHSTASVSGHLAAPHKPASAAPESNRGGGQECRGSTAGAAGVLPGGIDMSALACPPRGGGARAGGVVYQLYVFLLFKAARSPPCGGFY